MKIATSRISPQGQISVPAEVRALLGVAPGATLEWEAEDGVVRVRRAGRFSSVEIHKAVFGSKPPKRRSIEEMDAALAARMKEKHARR